MARPAGIHAVISLFRARETLYFFTLKEIKVKYQQVSIGFSWALLSPLLYMVIISGVTSMFLRFPEIPSYPIFLLVGLLPWTYLQMCVVQASTAIVENSNLIRKVSFRREIIPLSKVLSNLVDFLAAFVLLVLYILFIAPVHASPALLLIPVILALQLAFVVGVALLMAALAAMFTDVRYAKEPLMILWFYASPIFYPDTVVPGCLRVWYYLNPLAGIIHCYRRVLLAGALPDPCIAAGTAGLSVLLLWGGYRVFRHYERAFVDTV